MKRGTARNAKAETEKAVAHYKERAADFDFGLAPDADYAGEVMEAYLATFPRATVER
jgi:hypothetical protein